MKFEFSPDFFRALGSGIMQRSTSRINNTFMRRFKSYFGTGWFYCSLLWELSWKPVYNLPNIARPEHLLWALMHMKLYSTENVLASLANCDEKTFRKWSKIFREVLANVMEEKVSEG